MRRIVTASALLAAAGAAAWSQTPPPAAKTAKTMAAPAPKPPTTLDGQIAAALAHDADVQVARAKIQLAEGELAKARQAVAHKVTALHGALEEARQAMRSAEEGYALINTLFQRGQAGQADVIPYRQKLETGKARLAGLEAELKLLTGSGPGAAGAAPADALHAAAAAVQCSACHAVPGAAGAAPAGRPLTPQENLRKWLGGSNTLPVAGPVPARIRAALDTPVRLGAKGESVKLDRALEVFRKEAGLDVPVRFPPSPPTAVATDGEELPVGAWLQLFQDAGGYSFYVREYGLLVANKQSAPPDAQTVTEFWRTKPAGGSK